MKRQAHKPAIGITKPGRKPVNFPYRALWFSIRLGGGRPVVLSPDKPAPREKIHGLMLGGGTDVFPGLFQTTPRNNYNYDIPRDEMEMKWLQKADQENLPVFAICRGAQLMNVVNNGTLFMDISRAYPGTRYPESILGYAFFRKKINVMQDSLLHQIFKKEELMVNSLHKQSVDKVGDGLQVTAREPNGIVQAIENPGHPFYLGVQFHPELLIYQSAFRSFFRKFIGAARARMD